MDALSVNATHRPDTSGTPPTQNNSEGKSTATLMSGSDASTPSSPGLVYIGTKDTSLAVDGTRKRISRMRRGVITAARLMEHEMQEGGQRYRVAFVTVTYRPGESWDAGDIRVLVKHYRQWALRRDFTIRIVWVAETHGGYGANYGQIHYHLVLFVPRGVSPPMPDKQGWWRKGMTNCKWAMRPVGYLAKYTSKGLSGPSLPSGARMWAHSGLSSTVRTRLAFALAPIWLQRFCQSGEIVKKLAHGWWRNCTTGWEYRSPWEFEWGDNGPRVKFRGWSIDDLAYKP